MAGYIGSRLSNSVVSLDGVTIGSATKFQPFIGSIAAFAMSSAPSGWLVCNGAAYAIADYGDLYGVIGTTWGALTDGAGNSGTTHFVVPDLRGEFLRGFDNGQGNDPDAASRTGGDAVGSSQTDEFKSHNHTIPMHSPSNTSKADRPPWDSQGTNSTAYTNVSGGNETRPRNKYVQYCIKY